MIKNTWIPFDINNRGLNFYVECTGVKRAIWYLDFKFSVNIWHKFCLWVYKKRYKHNKTYWIKKKNIISNVDAYFTVKVMDGETHYLGWICKNEK